MKKYETIVDISYYIPCHRQNKVVFRLIIDAHEVRTEVEGTARINGLTEYGRRLYQSITSITV